MGGYLAQRTLCDIHKSLPLWPTNSNKRKHKWSSKNLRAFGRAVWKKCSLYVQLFSITCTRYVLSHVRSQSSVQHLLLLHVAIFESRRCLSLQRNPLETFSFQSHHKIHTCVSLWRDLTGLTLHLNSRGTMRTVRSLRGRSAS